MTNFLEAFEFISNQSVRNASKIFRSKSFISSNTIIGNIMNGRAHYCVCAYFLISNYIQIWGEWQTTIDQLILS